MFTQNVLHMYSSQQDHKRRSNLKTSSVEHCCLLVVDAALMHLTNIEQLSYEDNGPAEILGADELSLFPAMIP